MNTLPWLTILTLVPFFSGIVIAGLGARTHKMSPARWR